jgi:hypothetical protein
LFCFVLFRFQSSAAVCTCFCSLQFWLAVVPCLALAIRLHRSCSASAFFEADRVFAALQTLLLSAPSYLRLLPALQSQPGCSMLLLLLLLLKRL